MKTAPSWYSFISGCDIDVPCGFRKELTSLAYWIIKEWLGES